MLDLTKKYTYRGDPVEEIRHDNTPRGRYVVFVRNDCSILNAYNLYSSDLTQVKEKKVGWTAIYRGEGDKFHYTGAIYSSENEAKTNVGTSAISISKIEWEE